MENIKFHTIFHTSRDLENSNHIFKWSSDPSAVQREQELVNDPNKRRTGNCWSQSRGGKDTRSMEIQALTSKITQLKDIRKELLLLLHPCLPLCQINP